MGTSHAACAYLAAINLTLETTDEPREDIRRRALAALAVFGIGALFLIPSLWFLYRVFKAELPGAVDVGYGSAGREQTP